MKVIFTSWRFCRKISIVWIRNIQVFYSKYWFAIWILQLLKSVLTFYSSKDLRLFSRKIQILRFNVDATHLISRNFLFQQPNSRNFLFDKNFVKATFSLKKLLNSRFHEIFLLWENLCMMLHWFFHRLNVF